MIYKYRQVFVFRGEVVILMVFKVLTYEGIGATQVFGFLTVMRKDTGSCPGNPRLLKEKHELTDICRS